MKPDQQVRLYNIGYVWRTGRSPMECGVGGQP